MTKFEWERQLKKGMESLPRSEQQRVLEYYNELFNDKIDAGMREQDIISEFGNPYDVANKILVDFYTEGRESAETDAYVLSDTEKMEETFEEPKSEAKDESRKEETETTSERSEPKTTKTKIRIVEKPRKEKKKSPYGLITIICVLLFFVIGACFNKWHPAWMIFLLIPVVMSLIEAIEKRDYRRFCYPVFIVFVYLALGFSSLHIWHPTWVLFITIPLYYVLGSYVSKNSGGVSSDDEEKDEGEEKKNSKVIVVSDKKDKVIVDSDKKKVVVVSDKKDEEKPSKPKRGGAGRTVAGIILTIVSVFIMITVWSLVISLFVSGIAMIASGAIATVSAFIGMAAAFDASMIALGGALITLGLGCVFAFGMAGLFKPCAKMCKELCKAISNCFGNKEKA